MTPKIHPTAIVDPAAKIADDVTIGAYAIIDGDVSIGSGCMIDHHAFIGTGARIGERCQIHHGAVVSNVPQDLKFKGSEKTYVELGDDCIVREFATIHRGTTHEANTNAGTHDAVTRIGRGVLVMAYAHVAHDCSVGDGVILANAVQLAGHVTVEKWATIGGAALVHQFCLIGMLAMVSGGARARKDVPPFALTTGGDARFAGVNRIGLQRRGMSPEAIQAIKESYNTLYNSGLNVTDAATSIQDSPANQHDEVRHLLHFISLSKRGIIGAS